MNIKNLEEQKLNLKKRKEDEDYKLWRRERKHRIKNDVVEINKNVL